MADKTFEKWWRDNPEAVSDNYKVLAESAYKMGLEIGMARSRNYTANSAVDPDRIHFANGRVVKLSRATGRLYLSILEGEKRA